METQNSPAVVDRHTGEVIERPVGAQPLEVSPYYVEQQIRSLAMLKELVGKVLKTGRDFGRLPGTAADMLFDSGTQMILGAFNCHIGPRRVLSLVNTDDRIAAIVEVPVVTNGSGVEIATGVGAASTLETKHKYRWVSNPEEWGYTQESIETLEKKERYGTLEYKIRNPEMGELLNTVITMASKRAESDAAKALPGVGGLLKELFERKPERQGADTDKWAGFWAKTKELGLTNVQVHAKLKVVHMGDWLKAGKSLEAALDELKVVLAAENPPTPPTVDGKPKRDPNTIKTFGQLYQACHDDFGLTRQGVLTEAGYRSQEDIAEPPSSVYTTIASLQGKQEGGADAKQA